MVREAQEEETGQQEGPASDICDGCEGDKQCSGVRETSDEVVSRRGVESLDVFAKAVPAISAATLTGCPDSQKSTAVLRGSALDKVAQTYGCIVEAQCREEHALEQTWTSVYASKSGVLTIMQAGGSPQRTSVDDDEFELYQKVADDRDLKMSALVGVDPFTYHSKPADVELRSVPVVFTGERSRPEADVRVQNAERRTEANHSLRRVRPWRSACCKGR